MLDDKAHAFLRFRRRTASNLGVQLAATCLAGFDLWRGALRWHFSVAPIQSHRDFLGMR
jgi:hypothetical protein